MVWSNTDLCLDNSASCLLFLYSQKTEIANFRFLFIGDTFNAKIEDTSCLPSVPFFLIQFRKGG